MKGCETICYISQLIISAYNRQLLLVKIQKKSFSSPQDDSIFDADKQHVVVIDISIIITVVDNENKRCDIGFI